MKKMILGIILFLFIDIIVNAQEPMRYFIEDSSSVNFLVGYFPVALVIIVIILAVVAIGKNNSSQVLVLKEFKLNEKEDEFLIIKGRTSGLLGWILSLCGIDPETTLTCNKRSIKYEMSAIRFGKQTLNIPLVAVTCVSSGIHKPFSLLVLGVVFVLGGIISSILLNSFSVFMIGLIIGAVFLIIYYLNKTMRFSIFCGGDKDKPMATINLKKSIIEGQNIDDVKYASAAGAINKAVLMNASYIVALMKEQNNLLRQQLGLSPNSVVSADNWVCKKCGNTNRRTALFCNSCGEKK